MTSPPQIPQDSYSEWLPKFSWSQNATKAASHLLYSILSLVIAYLSTYLVPSIQGHWIFAVPLIQAGLKSAANWLQEHIT